MNLAHLKKLSEDDDYFHVQDMRAGDSFRVAKKGLSAELHGQIAQHFSGGGDVEETADPDLKAIQKENEASRAAMLANSAPAPSSGPLLSLPPASPEVQERLAMATQRPVTDAPATPPPMAAQAPPPMAQPGPAPAPGMSVPTDGTGGFAKKLGEVGKQEEEAIRAKSKVEADKSAFDLAAAQHMEQQQNEAHQIWSQRYEQNLAQQQKLTQDVANGEIAPDRWWHNRSAAQQVAGTIGLILGGIGEAFGGGPNQAKELIDKSIARDIEAQKANLGKKQTLLGDLMKQGYSIQEAEKLATAQAQSVYQGALAKGAAQFGTATAQANAQKAIADLKGNQLSQTQEVMQRGFQNHIELAKLDVERAKIAAAAQKAGEALPPEAVKVNNQLTALSDTVRLAKLHAKTNALETLIPFGTTPSNVYNEELKARGANMAAGKLSQGRETPEAVRTEVEHLPKASGTRALARENFSSQWDAIHKAVTNQIATFESSGKYDKSQLADMRQKLKAAESEAATEGLISGAGRVTVVNGQGQRGSVDATELAAHPDKYTRVD